MHDSWRIQFSKVSCPRRLKGIKSRAHPTDHAPSMHVDVSMPMHISCKWNCKAVGDEMGGKKWTIKKEPITFHGVFWVISAAFLLFNFATLSRSFGATSYLLQVVTMNMVVFALCMHQEGRATTTWEHEKGGRAAGKLSRTSKKGGNFSSQLIKFPLLTNDMEKI